MKLPTFFTHLLPKPTPYQVQKQQAQSLVKQVREQREVHGKLRDKLVQMLNGNVAEAEKLVARQRFGKDGMYSDNYYYWLAIRKLEEQQKAQRANSIM